MVWLFLILLQKCIACLELEVNLVRNLRKTSVATRNNNSNRNSSTKSSEASSRKMTHALFSSLTSSSETPQNHKNRGDPELLGNLIFYNIVILEAMKAPLDPKKTSPSSISADSEHIACQSLYFLTLTLDFFVDDLLQLRAADSGRNACRVLDFLKGPYLAQLIQSCLQFSQHR